MNYDGPPLSMLLCPVGPEFHNSYEQLAYYQNQQALGQGILVEVTAATFAMWLNNVKVASAEAIGDTDEGSWNITSLGQQVDQLWNVGEIAGNHPFPLNRYLEPIEMGGPYRIDSYQLAWYSRYSWGVQPYDLSFFQQSMSIVSELFLLIIADKFYAWAEHPSIFTNVQLTLSPTLMFSSFSIDDNNFSASISVNQSFFP